MFDTVAVSHASGHHRNNLPISSRFITAPPLLVSSFPPPLSLFFSFFSSLLSFSRYWYDNFTTYSPPITVQATSLAVANWDPVSIAILFTNNAHNLQLLIDPTYGMNVSVGWSPQVAPAPAERSGATNAAAIVRGSLLYALYLNESTTTVRSWVTNCK